MINVSIIHHESLRFTSSNNVLDKKVKKLICLIVPHKISEAYPADTMCAAVLTLAMLMRLALLSRANSKYDSRKTLRRSRQFPSAARHSSTKTSLWVKHFTMVSTLWLGAAGCDPKMGLRCISLRLLTCGYVRHFLVVRIAQNAVDFSVFKGVGSQILGDRRLA